MRKLNLLCAILLCATVSTSLGFSHQASNTQQDTTSTKSKRRSRKTSDTTGTSGDSSSTTTAKSKKSGKQGPGDNAKVDLNTASQSQLESLPGVGPATAKKIMAARPYASPADLSRAGVPAKTINNLTPMVTAGNAPSSTSARPTSSAPAQTASARSSTRTSTSNTQAAAGQPGPGMVWVNPETKVFHRQGDPWYGKTKKGQYMTESDAIKAGYRESKKK